jgi:spore germination protein YaaH
MKHFMNHILLFCCVWILLGLRTFSYADGINQNQEMIADNQTCSVLGAIPYWDQNKAIESFRNNINLIDYLSVFWYYMDPDGKIRKYVYANEDQSLIDYAHKHGVKVFALIANLPDDEREGADSDWEPMRVGHMLNSKQHRQEHIEDLLELTLRMNFDGILIDYEALPGKYRVVYSLFIEELAKKFHKNNKQLAVALHPKTSAHNPRENNGSHAQDWGKLHQFADQLHIMTYGEHTSSTGPGPIATPGWLQRVFDYAIKERQVPVDKLYVGAPLYGEVWEQAKMGKYRGLDIDLTFNDVSNLKNKYHSKEMWSKIFSSPHLVYKNSEGRKRIIWYENMKSFEAKRLVWEEHGVCNIAFWRLGNEDPGVWSRLRDLGY